MNITDVQRSSQLLVQQIERSIVGKRATIELVVMALLADGHVLLEDVPGVAKTATARALAEASGMDFSRVQFTPDLIPADITGAAVFVGGDVNGGIEFKPGPIFANLVLGDEINRAPPKTQSALLEAMEERQVTVDGESRELPKPFMVIGTQNPIESEGTYPLPEAQMDRFLIRTGIGYPETADEIDLILRRAERKTERLELDRVVSASEVAALQDAVETVHVSQPVARYIVEVVEATRTSPRTIAGASPRGSLGLLKACRARAAMAGRSFVLPDDVKAIAVPVLAHRLLLLPDQWVRGVKTEQVIAEVLQQVPAPVATDENENAASGPGENMTELQAQSSWPQSGGAGAPHGVAPRPPVPQPVPSAVVPASGLPASPGTTEAASPPIPVPSWAAAHETQPVQPVQPHLQNLPVQPVAPQSEVLKPEALKPDVAQPGAVAPGVPAAIPSTLPPRPDLGG